MNAKDSLCKSCRLAAINFLNIQSQSFMHRGLNLLVAVFFCSVFSAQAQNKYAVLVGINDYYQSPGIKHSSSLHGCVNDALSIKELLQNRFGFIKENIYTLFDSAATRTAVLNLMHRVLNKATAGDAVLFYYSGHGVWMNNAFQLDSVKRKMSQAMAMSNLYAPDLGCLLTDEDLKTVFNRFVDKKVIATALLDCCYSGYMIAPPAALAYAAQYWWPALAATPNQKAIELNQIDYISQRQKPAGCPVDLGNGLLVDTDGDGVPDCRDWQLNTPANAAVDSLGVASAEAYIKHSADPRFAGFSTDSATAVAQAKAFNLKDELTVNYLPKAVRPADRAGSRFLSLAASTDYQKAAEITDETRLRHGAFTKALLTLYKSSPVALNVSELINKVTASLKSQDYGQTPVYLSEKSRLSGNLIGISDKSFSNIITTTCTNVAAGRISFDKGLYASLSNGSVLKSSDGKKIVHLDSVTASSSSGRNEGAAIRAGEKFTLVDGYVSSAPVVKLYVPEAPFTQSSFAAFFSNKIAPVVTQAGYADYYVLTYGAAQHVKLYQSEKKAIEFEKPAFLLDAKKSYTILLLPLPSYIITPLKKMIAKNQNIQLVNNAAEADYVLYLNYAKKREGAEAAYVFYYRPRTDAKSEGFFALEKFTAPTLAPNAKSLQALCESLYSFSVKTIRYKNADVWMNEQKRK